MAAASIQDKSLSVKAKLTLSAVKIYKYGSYWMRLSIGTDFRKSIGLREQDVVVAGLAGKCCRLGTNHDAVVCVLCNPSMPVVTVSEPCGETCAKISPDGMEQYQFSLRSNCTSSRDHLKALLFMEVKLTDSLTLSSPFFALRARKKPGRPKKFPPTITSEPSFDVSPRSLSYEIEEKALDSHLKPEPSEIHFDENSSLVPKAVMNSLNFRAGSPTPLSSHLLDFQLQKQPNVIYVTRALSVTMSEESWNQLFSHFKYLVLLIPGIVDVGSAFISKNSFNGIAILTLAHEDSETRRTTVEQCFTIFSLYLANLIPGYPNVFQGDLLSTGTVAVVPC